MRKKEDFFPPNNNHEINTLLLQQDGQFETWPHRLPIRFSPLLHTTAVFKVDTTKTRRRGEESSSNIKDSWNSNAIVIINYDCTC